MSFRGVGLSRFWWDIYLSILLIFSVAISSCGPVVKAATAEPTPKISITIKVTSATPGVEINTASAKILGTMHVDTLEDKLLLLPYCSKPNHISVWSPGYYIHTFPCTDKLIYNETLRPLEVGDNANYSWVGANFPAGSQQTCASCHSDAQGRGETREWMQDGHSRVFVDPYFRTIYTGTDVFRNPGSETKWGILENGQKMRLPTASPYGPGFRLDYPRDSGNCAFCHVPAAVTASNQQADLTVPINNSSGTHVSVETEGVTCDVCHKVVDVLVGEDKRPFIEKPGILSFFFTRPEIGKLFYIGPLAEHKPSSLMEPGKSEDMGVCSPVFSESRFCAACHYGKFFDTLIYNSYGEWLDSNYSKKEIETAVGAEKKENMEYRSCQDCHMQSVQPIDSGTLLKDRAACSETNHSFNNFNHNMMGRDQNNEPTLVKEAAEIHAQATKEEGVIKVTVQVRNIGAGHKFPTDSPLRHLILVVQATDRNGTFLAQVDGPVIPLWGGVGDKTEDYAGHPGEIYANILKDKDTSEAPTVAYWNPTIPAWEGSDTRLIPGVIVQSDYSFAIPSNGAATINAELIYRYAFIDIIRQKGWPPGDYIVTQLPNPIQVP